MVVLLGALELSQRAARVLFAGHFPHKEHQNGLNSAFARRTRRFLNRKCLLYKKRHEALPPGAARVLRVVWSLYLLYKKRHGAPPPGAARLLWGVLSSLLCAFVKYAGGRTGASM